MPSSKKAEADTLRNAAKIYRELGSKRRIRLWEEEELKDRGGFISTPSCIARKAIRATQPTAMDGRGSLCAESHLTRNGSAS
jgi:hypothetical protein